MKMGYSWKNSIFLRLILTFFAVTVPIFVLGYYIYNWGFRAINQELEKSVQVQTDFYSVNFSNDLNRIHLLIYDLFNDNSLESLSYGLSSLSNYALADDSKRLQQRLETIKSSSRYIQDVEVYIPLVKRVINTSRISDFTDKDIEFLKLFTEKKTTFQYFDEMRFIYAIPAYDKSKENNVIPFTIVVRFSVDEIKKMLEELNTYEGSGAILLNGEDDIISYTGFEIINEKNIIKRFLTHIDQEEKKLKEKHGFIEDNNYLIAYASIHTMDLTFIRYIPRKDLLKGMEQYHSLFWIFVTVSIVIIFIFGFSTYQFVHRPLYRLTKAFEQVEKGDLNVIIEHNHQDEFKSIYKQFNSMTHHLSKLIDQVYKQKILTQKTELKQLQAQINPHFLYNSFFLLHRFLKYEYYDEAILFSKDLGNYFQFITRSASDYVTLKAEMEHARSYIEIQSVRFSNRITITCDELPKELEELQVPRLIIQPIIENVFKHGLEDLESNGILNVCFDKNDLFFLICIEDNGKKMTKEMLQSMKQKLEYMDETMEVTGMFNIHQRLKLKFGEESGIELSQSELGGLKVLIKIGIGGDRNV